MTNIKKVNFLIVWVRGCTAVIFVSASREEMLVMPRCLQLIFQRYPRMKSHT